MRAPWRALAREPIVHFVVASALVFAVYAFMTPPKKQVIRVEEATVEALMRERGGILMRPLTPQDRVDVIETYIGEEILLREANKRGLDRTPRIRAQVVQLMRHALATETSTPGDKDLRRFFEENRARYERPAAISLVQVLLANGKSVPDGLIDRLNAGANPAAVGDFDLGLGSTIRRASADNLASLFGREASLSILAIADDCWHGPFSSARGMHFVRVSERHPPEIPAFEQVATYVEKDWESARQSEATARALKILEREYVVVRPAPDKR